MAQFNTELRSVPALNKQELLLYILDNCPDVALQIVTNSGQTYYCKALHLAMARGEEAFLVLQIMDNRNDLLNRFLHVAVQKIESIELIDPADVVNVLSRGSVIKSKTYEPSGKLEVKRAFQSFQEAIVSSTGINVGTPKMELPADGLQLNRILQLTQIIQTVLIELLQQPDAAASWKSAITALAFVNHDHIQVNKEAGLLEIRFPFEKLTAPEITSKELMPLLMGVL
jgi:hypothetical protein